jgi:hypothetical protein
MRFPSQNLVDRRGFQIEQRTRLPFPVVVHMRCKWNRRDDRHSPMPSLPDLREEWVSSNRCIWLQTICENDSRGGYHLVRRHRNEFKRAWSHFFPKHQLEYRCTVIKTRKTDRVSKEERWREGVRKWKSESLFSSWVNETSFTSWLSWSQRTLSIEKRKFEQVQ